MVIIANIKIEVSSKNSGKSKFFFPFNAMVSIILMHEFPEQITYFKVNFILKSY